MYVLVVAQADNRQREANIKRIFMVLGMRFFLGGLSPERMGDAENMPVEPQRCCHNHRETKQFL
jgi:hypothetical protein